MRRPIPSRNRLVVAALTALALMLLSQQSALATQQQSSYKPPVDPASAPPRVKAMVEAINQRARELGLIAISDDPEQAAFVRRRLNAQLSEDFEKLHSIDIEKLCAPSLAGLDYKVLADVTADLKTRATRIKYNVPVLQFASKGEKIRYEDNPEYLATMLPELGGLIKSFLSSPVFRLSSPNDVELRLKAGRDLESIIKISDAINKIAKRSTKTAALR
jgi:hypothetical protein